MQLISDRRGNRFVNRIVIFRSFAREATKNSHSAIKACWAILFTGGTIALLHSFDNLINCRFSLDLSPQQIQDPLCSEIQTNPFYFYLVVLLFVIYLLTFYRFYVGNIRVFDMIYDEVFKFIDSLHEVGTQGKREDEDYQNLLDYSDNLIKWESLFLILTTLIIVYLTVTPLNAAKFLSVYEFLLVADVIWLGLLRLLGAHKVATVRDYIRSRFFENFAELQGG